MNLNLKEAFRFQNKLQSLQHETMCILGDDRNVTRTETTLFHKKVMAEAENEVTRETPPSEYADRIDLLVQRPGGPQGRRKRRPQACACPPSCSEGKLV